MAAHVIRRFWHVSEKQRIVNSIIASSYCWAGVNDLHDLHSQLTRIQPRNIKGPTAIGPLNINNTKEIITQMEYVGTEANGGLATYGEYGCDYSTARDFVIAQAFLMNDLKKYTETVGYSPKNPKGMRTYEDMLQDFSDWWDDPDGEWWYDLAMFYFDGHELTDKEREAL